MTPLYVLLMSTSFPMSARSCPSGTTNAAGDDASGSDTTHVTLMNMSTSVCSA